VRNKVSFRPWKAHLILGKTLPTTEMESILHSLEFEVHSSSEEEWEISVPGCRVDVTREIDVIEEILRIYSFDEIPPSSQFQFSWNQSSSSHFHIQHEIAKALVAQGFNEIQCLSLTKESYPTPTGSSLIPILNPLSSDLGVLRASLLHGGLETISFNIKRKNADLKIFEMGKVYEKTADGYREEWMLSVWITGQNEKESSSGTSRPISFREMRNCLEQLAQMAGISINMGEKVEHSFFVECIQYPFKKGQFQLGWVADDLLKLHDIEQPVICLTLPLTPFMQLVNRHQPGSPQLYKFPSVRRDLSLLMDRPLLFQDIEKAAFQAEKKFLKEVFLFDVYEGEHLPQGKKSYAVGFVLRDDSSTMNDQQIDLCMKKILQSLVEQLGVELRG
jgi:phenylalanyl-tRNA synthetase beta chain